MSLLALFIWIGTAAGGFFLLSVWLIEYDKDLQPAYRSRLSVPLILAHALPAGGGIVAWGAYLIFGWAWLAWLAVTVLVIAVTVGLLMATRWLSVYRVKRAQMRYARARRGSTAEFAALLAADEGPAERHFPLVLVLGHGALAATTVTLVVIVALKS
jgi:manganese efflux pump family protein